jgi:two-component system, NarL family, sensor kinase
MRNCFLIVLMLVKVYPAASQSTQSLLDSAWHYYNSSNFGKARALCGKIQDRVTSTSPLEDQYRLFSLLGNIDFRNGSIRSAMIHQKKCLSIANKQGDREKQAKAVLSFVAIYYSLGQLDSAEIHLKNVEEYMPLSDKTLATFYFRKAMFFSKRLQVDSAITAYHKCILVGERLGDTLGMARAYHNIGNLYWENRQFDACKQYHKEAIALLGSKKYAYTFSGMSVNLARDYEALGQFDSAAYVLKYAMKTIQGLTLDLPHANILEMLGRLESRQRRYTEALKIFERADSIYETLDSWEELSRLHNSMGECYMAIGNLSTAEVYLDKSLALSKKNNHLEGMELVYKNKASLDSMRGNFRDALANYKEHVRYKDSLTSIARTKALEEITAKFELQKKEKLIAEQKMLIDWKNRQEILFMAIIAIVVTASLVIFFMARKRSALRLEVEKQDHKKREIFSVLLAQEKLQQHIAKDIHDGFLQLLGVAKMKLQLVQPTMATSAIGEVVEVIDKACGEARGIAHRILPYTLQRHGIRAAIEELMALCRDNPKQHCELDSNIDHEHVPEEVAINIYRIAQELLQNIDKHARASEVRLSLKKFEGKIVLCVSDNGVGFNPEQVIAGAGLLNIRSRVKMVDGELKIESEPGAGTMVLVKIPNP